MFQPLYPGERGRPIHSVGGCMGLRAGLDMTKRKFPVSARSQPPII